MAVLSVLETKKIIAEFVAENARKLECNKYEYGELVRREGAQIKSIYIVKEGVFRINRMNSMTSNSTVDFNFPMDVIVPIIAVANDFPSLFQVKSIENNLTKNYNSLYEISLEQWNKFAEKDDVFKILLTSIIHNNLSGFIDFFMLFRQNRNVKKLFYEMYDMKHPILNSNISHRYIAEYFGINQDTLEKLYLDKKLDDIKKK